MKILLLIKLAILILALGGLSAIFLDNPSRFFMCGGGLLLAIVLYDFFGEHK